MSSVEEVSTKPNATSPPVNIAQSKKRVRHRSAGIPTPITHCKLCYRLSLLLIALLTLLFFSCQLLTANVKH